MSLSAGRKGRAPPPLRDVRRLAAAPASEPSVAPGSSLTFVLKVTSKGMPLTGVWNLGDAALKAEQKEKL